jgi:hypothetical protein
MKAIFVLLIVAVAAAAQTPAVTFTKSFPGSQPPFVSVQVMKTGALEYKESPSDERPLKAQLSPDDVSFIFDSAEKLQFFREQIESGLKVANTGKKTFRFDDGTGKTSETVFNYSQNLVAQQLLNRFEQIAQSERCMINLERTVKFDKLGVNDALAQIESLWLRKELTAPQQFVPLLNRVATHESYMHLARERAARLRDQFQTPGPPNASAKGPAQ